MNELERTAVQLWEAKRLAEHEDVAHGRLALLLLDNAAEISLMRSATSRMRFAEIYGDMAYMLRDFEPEDVEGQYIKQRIEEGRVSKRRRTQVERNFDSLVDFVFEQQDLGLAAEFADCLKILHRYRNAAYHRDTVRADVLASAVQIYFFLCCYLMKNERSMVHEISNVPAAVREILGEKSLVGTWPDGGFDTNALANLVADRFLADLRLDHGRIARALSEHLLARLAEVDRDLTTIGENIPPGVNRGVALRLVQLAPLDRHGLEAEPPRNFWTQPLAVTEEILDTWIVTATEMRNVKGALDALRSFSDIEQPLETLEVPVARFIEELDRTEQQKIDEYRGN